MTANPAVEKPPIRPVRADTRIRTTRDRDEVGHPVARPVYVAVPPPALDEREPFGEGAGVLVSTRARLDSP